MTDAQPISENVRRQLLENSPFFGGLPPEKIAAIAAETVSRQVSDGEVIYHRGDQAEAFYGIVSGRVLFSAQSLDGKAMTTGFMEQGEWFGNVGIFDGGPRIVDARASGTTRLVMMRRASLMTLCQSNPDILWQAVEQLSAQLRVAGQLLEDAVFHGLPLRLARRLLDLEQSHGITCDDGRLIDMHLPQDELGRMVGVTREAAGRQLSAWKRNGWIDMAYGKITIKNRTALVSIVTLAGEQVD